jgi:hypothetical protein
MADNFDANPALRAELNTAVLPLSDQVDGLFALTKIVEPGPLQELVRTEMKKSQTRLDAMRRVLSDLDRVIVSRQLLAATGYPSLEGMSLPADQFALLKVVVDRVNLAELAFNRDQTAIDQPATEMVVTLGPSVDKKK